MNIFRQSSIDFLEFAHCKYSNMFEYLNISDKYSHLYKYLLSFEAITIYSDIHLSASENMKFLYQRHLTRSKKKDYFICKNHSHTAAWNIIETGQITV